MGKTHRTTPARGQKKAQWRGQTRGSKRISLAEEGADDQEREVQGWPVENDEEENTVTKKGKTKKKKKAVEKEVVAKEGKVEAMKEEMEEKEGGKGVKGETTEEEVKKVEKEVYGASVWEWGDDKW